MTEEKKDTQSIDDYIKKGRFARDIKTLFFFPLIIAFGLLMGGLGLLMTAAGFYLIYEQFEEISFKQKAQHVEGIVLDMGENKVDDSIEYYINYQFTIGEKVFTGTGNVDDDLYGELEIDGPINLMYLPAKPEKNRISRTNTVRSPIFIFFNLLMGAGGIFVFLSITVGYIKKIKRILYLNKHGIQTEGKVLHIIKREDEDSVDYMIEYDFEDSKGTSYKGKAEILSKRTTVFFSVGSEITILYDPENPHVNMWIHEHFF